MKKLLLLLIFPWANISAQSFITPNQILGQINSFEMAVPFLLISPDARAGGMGEGGAAICSDANAMHWNLSNLAFARKHTGLSISYAPWLRALVPDINHAYISFYTKLDSASAFAASVRYFSMGSVTFTGVTGTTIGQFRPNEFAFDLGYTRRLRENFSVGISGRLIHSNLTNGIIVAGQATKPVTSFCADVSASFRSDVVVTGSGMRQWLCGATLSNVGPKVSYSSATNRLPMPTRIAIASGLVFRKGFKHALQGQAEASKIIIPEANGYIENYWTQLCFSVGTEYVFKETFKVRCGYFFEPESIGNRQYVTLGAGIQYNVFELDFSYIPTNSLRSPLQDTLKFTLLFSFDRPKVQPYSHG